MLAFACARCASLLLASWDGVQPAFVSLLFRNRRLRFFYSSFELVLNMLCAFGAKEGAALRQNHGLVMGCSAVRQLTAVALHFRFFIPSRAVVRRYS